MPSQPIWATSRLWPAFPVSSSRGPLTRLFGTSLPPYRSPCAHWVSIFDLLKRRDVGSLSQHQGSISSLVFAGTTHLLSGGEDGRIALFRCKDWECLHILRHKKPIQALAVHPSGKLALSVGTERSLKLWNLMTGKQAHSATLPAEPLRMVFSASGKYYAILYVHTGSTSKVLVYATGTSTVVLEFSQATRLATIAFLRDDYLFVAGEGTVVQIINIVASIASQPPSPHLSSLETDQKPRIKDLAIVSASTMDILFTGSSSGVIKAWSWSPDTAKELFSHDSGIRITCLTATTAQ